MKLMTAILNWIFGKTQTQPPKTLSESETRAQSRQRIYARCQYHTWNVWPGGFDERYRALNYLIEIAETIEDLKMVLDRSHHTYSINFDSLWTKWLAMATSVEELEVMSRKCRDRDYATPIARKWFALAGTYAQIKATPYTADNVLRELIAEKRRTLAEEALKSAKNCEELIHQYNAIDDDDRPTSSLQSYAGWSNDDGLMPVTIKRLLESSVSLRATLKDARGEMEEKWRKSSIRVIQSLKSATEFTKLADDMHPEATTLLVAKWDFLSRIDVEVAEEEKQIYAALYNAREASTAKQFGCAKLSGLYEEQVRSAQTVDEVRRVVYKSESVSGLTATELGIEKWIRLASTETELRDVWDRTEKYPDLRRVLAKKLSSLIK